MGNTSTKSHTKSKHKKQVHWKAADRPAPPGKPQLASESELDQDVVRIHWAPPRYDGGSPIKGYLVEHRRLGSPHWVRATPLLVKFCEISLSGLEPGWKYQFRVSAENAVGISAASELSDDLIVTLQRTVNTVPCFTQELNDATALENDKTEFTAVFQGQPVPKVCWFKDGFEIFSSRRVRILTENFNSVLTIHQCALSDEGEIKCTITNRSGHASIKAKLTVNAPPSIRLPRQYEDGLLFELGEVIRLKVTLAGRPAPVISWFHNNEAIRNGNLHEIDTTGTYSSVRIQEAQRSDRGEYRITAINKLGEANSSFLITVTDKPAPPGQAVVIMTLGRSVTLSWATPVDDGGCKIGNYIVEYFRIGWDVWLKAATCRQLTTTVGELIEGSQYKFRVKAESPYGVSEPSNETDVVFIPDPTRGILTHAARGRSQTRDTLINAPIRRPRSQSASKPGTLPNKTSTAYFYQEGIPVRPPRSKTKSSSATPEASPAITRRIIPNRDVFDRTSLVRDMTYGSPDIRLNTFNYPDVSPNQINQPGKTLRAHILPNTDLTEPRFSNSYSKQSIDRTSLGQFPNKSHDVRHSDTGSKQSTPTANIIIPLIQKTDEQKFRKQNFVQEKLPGVLSEKQPITNIEHKISAESLRLAHDSLENNVKDFDHSRTTQDCNQFNPQKSEPEISIFYKKTAEDKAFDDLYNKLAKIKNPSRSPSPPTRDFDMNITVSDGSPKSPKQLKPVTAAIKNKSPLKVLESTNKCSTSSYRDGIIKVQGNTDYFDKTSSHFTTTDPSEKLSPLKVNVAIPPDIKRTASIALPNPEVLNINLTEGKASNKRNNLGTPKSPNRIKTTGAVDEKQINDMPYKKVLPNINAKTDHIHPDSNIRLETHLPKTVSSNIKYNLDYPKLPREESESLSNSSEFMLLLVPDKPQGKQLKINFEENTVPPPLSLSAPELGIEPPLFENLRVSVSSTELLHVYSNARLYDAISNDKPQTNIPKIQLNSKESMSLVGLERNNSLRRQLSTGITTPHQLWKLKTNSLRNSIESTEIPENTLRKFVGNLNDENLTTLEGKRELFSKRQRSQSEEREEEEFERVRAKTALIKLQTGNVQRKTIEVAQEEYWSEEESLSESDSESSKERGTRIYHDEEEEEEVIYRPSGIMRPNIHDPFEILTKPCPLPNPNFVPKPILKRADDIPAKPIRNSISTNSSLPKTANEKLDIQNIHSGKQKPFNLCTQNPAKMRKRESLPATPFEKISAAAEISGITAASVGMPQQRLPQPAVQHRTSEDEVKVVADHYGDIVRNYGQKTNTVPRQLYLNTEDLKAAANESDEEVSKINESSFGAQDLDQRQIADSLGRRNSFLEVSSALFNRVKEHVTTAFTAEEFDDDIIPPNEEIMANMQRRGSAQINKRRPSKVTTNKLEGPKPSKKSTPAATRSENWSNLRTPSPTPQGRKTSPMPTSRSPLFSPSSNQIRRNSFSSILPPSLPKPKTKEITTQTADPKREQNKELSAKTEMKVRTAMDYITDLAMFIVACWLYLFHNELLAIPVLAVMVYRQLKEEIKKRLPSWIVGKRNVKRK